MNEKQEPKDQSNTYLEFVAFFAAVEVAVAALLALGSGGCASVDPDAAYTIYTNIVVRIPGSATAGMDGPGSDDAAGPGTSSSTTDGVGDSGKGKSPEPASQSVVLDFRYGGFKGGKAQEDSRCRLGKGKITKDSISWKWETKIPSDWKRQDTKKGPMVIAAAFYWDGSKWVGGKMDFCNESRSSRSCTNINEEHYNGWDASAWASAKKRAFCVVSADGKWRSNLIED